MSAGTVFKSENQPMTAAFAADPDKDHSADKVAARGLKGVVAADTTICDVDGELGKLIYRGYNIHELAAASTFEETAYLLFQGELPNRARNSPTSTGSSSTTARSSRRCWTSCVRCRGTRRR